MVNSFSKSPDSRAVAHTEYCRELLKTASSPDGATLVGLFRAGENGEMEIICDLLNVDDKQCLDEWRDAHACSFACFQDGPDLPPNGFRTAGDSLYLGSAFYNRCFKRGGHWPGPLSNS